jgi:hypothetical protein
MTDPEVTASRVAKIIRPAALVRGALRHHVRQRAHDRRAATFTLRLASAWICLPKGMEPRWLARVHLPAPSLPNTATVRVTRCEWVMIACGGTLSAPRSNKRKQRRRRRPNVGASNGFPIRELSAVPVSQLAPLELARDRSNGSSGLFPGYSGRRRAGELGPRQAASHFDQLGAHQGQDKWGTTNGA